MNEKYEMMIERLLQTIKPHIIPFNEPWKVLISTVLSQRTKDETTAKVSNKLYEKYPANIVLSMSFDKDYIAVDTHVHRISNRLGWVKTNTPEETEIELEKIIDKKYWKILNGIMVEFGKNVCKPVNPRCDICPLNDICPSSRIVAKK